MKNFILRAITGILYVVVLVACTVYSPMSFFVFVAIVAAMTTNEFCQIIRRAGIADCNAFISGIATVALIATVAGYTSEMLRAKDFLPYLCTMLYLLISELYRKAPNPLANWAYAFASQLYIAIPFALLFVSAFRYDPMTNAVTYEFIFPLSVFVFLWTNDTGAYLCGCALSRYFPAKLFERISPKKSWVGSVGGALLCLVVGVLFSLVPDSPMTLPQWLGLSMVVCVFGTWGDLVESLLKRQLGIKDSGSILPGHGGLLDRFDSALLAIPAATVYMWFIS